MRTWSGLAGVGWRGKRRSPLLLLILALALTALPTVFLSESAQAAESVVRTICPPGTGAGQCDKPQGLAVNRSGSAGADVGDLYVVDSKNDRINQFSASGEFIRAFGLGVNQTTGGDICDTASLDTCQAGTSSGAAGAMNSPQGVAVDQTTGNVYVTDGGNRRVDIFSAVGVFQGAVGWGVIDGDAGPYSLDFCTAITGCQTGQSGTGAGQFGPAIGYPAIDPTNGHLYVGNVTNRRIDEFQPVITGGIVTDVSFVKAFGWDVIPSGQPGDTGTGLEACTEATTCQAAVAGGGPGQFSSGNPTSVAVDSTGSVYAVNQNNIGNCVETRPCRGDCPLFCV